MAIGNRLPFGVTLKDETMYCQEKIFVPRRVVEINLYLTKKCFINNGLTSAPTAEHFCG
jgi:hypothetical protein